MPFNTSIFRFEGFELDADRRLLQRDGRPVSLNARTFDLLVYLASHPRQLVTREELLEAIWPGTFVEEGNLTQHIFLLRRALASAGAAGSIVDTVSGKGYRFTPSVELAAQPVPPHTELPVQHSISITRIVAKEEIEEEDTEPERGWLLGGAAAPRRRWLSWGVVAVVAIAAIVAVRVNSAYWRITQYQQITHDGNNKSIGGTDGSRIYFTLESQGIITQVQATGGVAVPIDIPRDYQWVGNVSPDGSKLLVVSEAGGMGPNITLWTFQILGGALRRIPNAKTATWSPDGSRIVFVDAKADLYVCQSDGSGAEKLASPGGYVKSLSWSPDGRLIRFSKDGLLWQVDADGKNLRQLLPKWSKSATQTAGQWARDGRYYFISDGQIWMLEDRGILGKLWPATPEQLTFGPTIWDHPITGIDSKKIFAAGRTPRGEMVSIDPKTGQIRNFLDGISAEFLTYSSDGASIAYVTFPEGILWRANADGSHPTQLTSAPTYPKSIRWSPDGREILFVDSNGDGASSIYVLPSDGSEKPRRMLPNDRDAESDPSWSPDGRQVVFSTTQYIGVSATSEIRVLDVATNAVRTLPGSSGLAVPHWSPDGKTIAAMTLDSMSLKLFTLATQTWSNLEDGSVAFPEWSHDGRSLYYISWQGTGLLMRLTPADGHKQVIADLKGERFTGFYTSWMGLTPDDTPLMLRDIGRDDIYSLTLEKK